ncbi:MAG: hypothetical protein ACLTQL_11180 [Eisenbergiella sp.]
MIQDSIYLKNYARIYGKAIFHAATLREIQLYYSMLNFVNDTESEVRLDYLKQFCITDDDIELIAPLPENQNYIDFMFEIASHGKNEEILMAVLPWYAKLQLYIPQIGGCSYKQTVKILGLYQRLCG